MQKITPCLWFDDQAEEAAKFYVSIFKNSKIETIVRYGDAGPRPKGMVMTVKFQLDGRKFLALNGGPEFKFTEAVSFIVNCETQEEIDELWEKLSKDGRKVECGWLKDKYGLSWQIVPAALQEMLSDPDPKKTQNVVRIIRQMKKLDIKRLEQAYAQE